MLPSQPCPPCPCADPPHVVAPLGSLPLARLPAPAQSRAHARSAPRTASSRQHDQEPARSIAPHEPARTGITSAAHQRTAEQTTHTPQHRPANRDFAFARPSSPRAIALSALAHRHVGYKTRRVVFVPVSLGSSHQGWTALLLPQSAIHMNMHRKRMGVAVRRTGLETPLYWGNACMRVCHQPGPPMSTWPAVYPPQRFTPVVALELSIGPS